MPVQAALRELKEETGYVGTVAECSGVLTMSPGLCDEMIRLVVVEVDLDRPDTWLHSPVPVVFLLGSCSVRL